MQRKNLFDIKEDQLSTALKDFIQMLYFRYLAVNPKDRRVVIVESIFFPPYFRKVLTKLLFMHFDVSLFTKTLSTFFINMTVFLQVPTILFVPQHLVALTTLGISTALVLDVGYTETVAVPVIEGVTAVDALQFAPLGGKAINDRIQSEIVERKMKIKVGKEGNVVTQSLEEEILEEIKIKTCFVAPYERGVRLSQEKINSSERIECPISSPPPDSNFYIRGNKTLTIPGALRESVCEVLFEMYGEEHTIPTLIIDALLRCSIDVRKLLGENIVIIGGTSLIPGFKHRLMTELKKLVTSEKYSSRIYFDTFKFHQLPCKENYAAWLGASIFGATDAITTRSVTREQFLRNRHISEWNNWLPASG